MPRKTKKGKNGLTRYQQDEIKRCARDPEYFIMNYCMISSGGLKKFNLYDYQKDLLKKIRNNRFNIILKARQLGISELSAAYSNWLIYFHKLVKVSIIATNEKQAIHLMDKVKLSYDNLPEWMKSANPKKNDNQLMLKLSTESTVMAYSSGKDAVRGTTPTLLIIDEAAFIDDIEGVWLAAKPAVETVGSCVILSTPNGAGTWYHKKWEDAVAGVSNFIPTLLPWSVHPLRDQAWYERSLADLGKRNMAQEYECSFLASGDTVIAPEVLKRIEDNDIQKPINHAGIDGNFNIWRNYEDGHGYLVSLDVARGDAEDYHGMQIIDVDRMEQVAEYRGKMPIDEFSAFAYNICKEWQSPLLVAERNTFGWSVLNNLKKMGYTNLYYSKRKTKYEEEVVDHYVADNDDSMVPGFHTGPTTRPMIIHTMETFVRRGDIKVRSKRLLKEFRTFIYKNGKPQATRGAHDDLIMAFAIACHIVNTVFIEGTDKRKVATAALLAFRKNKTVINTMIPEQNDKTYKMSGDTMEAYNRYIVSTGGWANVLCEEAKGLNSNKKKKRPDGVTFMPFYRG
jgi:hypothetical protein